MDILEQIGRILDDFNDVYDTGYKRGKAAGGDNPLYYATQPQTLFIGALFPKDSELTLRFKNTPNTCQQMFYNAECPRSAKIIIENHTKSVSIANMFCRTSAPVNLISVDLSEIGTIADAFQAFDKQNLLETVLGDLDFSGCTGTNETANVFRGCSALREVRFKEKAIPKSISFKDSPNLSADSLQSIIGGLKDFEGEIGVEQLTLNSAIEVSSEQILKMSRKGWDLVQ